MDHAAYLDHVAASGRALAHSADAAGLGAPVPACPGWDVRALLDHVGMVHRWATFHVRDGASGAQPELEHAPVDGVLDWFRTGHADLVAALRRCADRRSGVRGGRHR